MTCPECHGSGPVDATITRDDSPFAGAVQLSCMRCERRRTAVDVYYRNHRGEIAWRTILPKGIWRGVTDWHKELQWFLACFDFEKNADRDFALRDILQWGRDDDGRVLVLPRLAGANEKLRDVVDEAKQMADENKRFRAALTSIANEEHTRFVGPLTEFCLVTCSACRAKKALEDT